MVTYEEALALVLENAPRMPAVTMSLAQAAGRVLAEDVVSDIALPPFDRSAMDGYAVRAADVTGVPAELHVVELIAAGYRPRAPVRAGECSRIMTGAPVPAGADAVIMIEDAEPLGEDRVRLFRAVKPGDNICFCGEDVHRGQAVVRQGARLRPFDIALAAAAGCTSLPVIAAPRVALLATGDEIVEPDHTPSDGRIRNCTSCALAARLGQVGIEAEYLGIAPDEPGALRARLEAGLERDVLIVSGGVSTGDHDLVAGLLRELGVMLLFQQVAVKPGRPAVFGRREHAIVFGLPGNPVATLVIAELLVIPALRKMMGEPNAQPDTVEATLDEPVSHKPDRMSLHPVTLRWAGDTWHARPVQYHGSADLAGAARGDGFAIIPQGRRELPLGATARVVRFH
jgi:molybdopterin molybdotransferase